MARASAQRARRASTRARRAEACALTARLAAPAWRARRYRLIVSLARSRRATARELVSAVPRARISQRAARQCVPIARLGPTAQPARVHQRCVRRAATRAAPASPRQPNAQRVRRARSAPPARHRISDARLAPLQRGAVRAPARHVRLARFSPPLARLRASFARLDRIVSVARAIRCRAPLERTRMRPTWPAPSCAPTVAQESSARSAQSWPRRARRARTHRTVG